MKATSPVVTIDDLGIHLSATWFRKAESIPWKRILAIGADERESTKICYVSEGGKIRYCLFILGIEAWNQFHGGWPEFQQLGKWVAYYGIVPACVPFSALCVFWGLLMFHTIRLTQWRSWKLTSNGFLRQNSYGQWETFVLCAGDRICPDALVIGGETFPLWRPAIGDLTHNAALPHLLALLARRHNIVPSPSRRTFPLGIAVRFAVFWPIVILGLWYAPLLIWEIPDGLDLAVQLNLLVVLGSCGIASVGFLLAGILEAPRHRARFSQFLAEVEEFQQRLQWGASGRIGNDDPEELRIRTASKMRNA